MSRSWVRSRGDAVDPGSTTERGQTEPLAALAAVLAVGIALVLYVDALSVASPSPTSPGVANATLYPVQDELSDGPVAEPNRISSTRGVGPDGYRINVTLTADGRTWSAGPVPPEEVTDTRRTEEASRPTSVRVAPGRIEPGQLKVVVWT